MWTGRVGGPSLIIILTPNPNPTPNSNPNKTPSLNAYFEVRQQFEEVRHCLESRLNDVVSSLAASKKDTVGRMASVAGKMARAVSEAEAECAVTELALGKGHMDYEKLEHQLRFASNRVKEIVDPPKSFKYNRNPHSNPHSSPHRNLLSP